MKCSFNLHWLLAAWGEGTGVVLRRSGGNQGTGGGRGQGRGGPGWSSGGLVRFYESQCKSRDKYYLLFEERHSRYLLYRGKGPVCLEHKFRALKENLVVKRPDDALSMSEQSNMSKEEEEHPPENADKKQKHTTNDIQKEAGKHLVAIFGQELHLWLFLSPLRVGMAELFITHKFTGTQTTLWPNMLHFFWDLVNEGSLYSWCQRIRCQICWFSYKSPHDMKNKRHLRRLIL